ncbi:lysine--tRNA ligase [Hyphomicrobiales bacterium]|nr:lysine--tRNA ligase [Hyphomicrobiales bacterium]|tara:strand:+ start:4010 stop:5587 length:1578 start_codon:yes stop_codon:yes gene_type:complete
MNKSLIADATESKSWPFEEARKIIKRLEKNKKDIVFETGYGPSGLPHIGTFGEVARTSMVRFALKTLDSSIESKIICFSDDMDGLRKVPDNIPNQKVLEDNLEKPLSTIPDPYGKYKSYAEHNNSLLKDFLNQFGFEYEFMSATEQYLSGNFDNTLKDIMQNYDAISNTILPTLGEARRETYSPFLPICEETGKVLMAKVLEIDKEKNTILYQNDRTNKEVETSVLKGKCKLQWKVDWAMRWVSLGVDYEMAGKDLIESVNLSSKICRVLGKVPPEGFNYELFLDQNGEKISKSKGNGITINEWLKYANPESLSLYMYQKPRRAKKLSFDVIPKAVDEYQTFLEKYSSQTVPEQLNNPVFHIHNGQPNSFKVPVSFALILNLVNASQADNKDVLWGFIKGYMGDISEDAEVYINQLLGYALSYFNDFVLPKKSYREASEKEIGYLEELVSRFSKLDKNSEAETIQTIVYDIGKEAEYENLRDWFMALYQILLGQEQGPRFGSFVALYGIDKTCELINRAIKKELI